MADKLLSGEGVFSEYDAAPAAADVLYFVDATGPTKKKIKAQRFAVTDGTPVNFTGGGTFVLGNYTLTASGSGTAVEQDTAETWTNKAFVTPTIASLANATHDHSTDAKGGGLAIVAAEMPIYRSQSGIYPNTIEDTWVDVDEARTSFWLNGSHMPSTDTMQLVVWCYPASKAHSYRIYNETAGAAVIGSTAVSSGGAAWEEAVSANFRAGVASGLNRYHIQIYNATSGGDDGLFISASILMA